MRAVLDEEQVVRHARDLSNKRKIILITQLEGRAKKEQLDCLDIVPEGVAAATLKTMEDPVFIHKLRQVNLGDEMDPKLEKAMKEESLKKDSTQLLEEKMERLCDHMARKNTT